VVSFRPRPLQPQGKSPSYPLNKRLGGLQIWSGRGSEKNSQLLPGPEHPTTQPIAQRCTTELPGSTETGYEVVERIKLVRVKISAEFL
jgi:hypothetical protein